jgi:hypothetical protein
MSMDKTIRRVTRPDEQQHETYRYWQNQSIGARLVAISEFSQEAYTFAAAFKGPPTHDEQGLSRHPPRIQRSQG